MVPRGTPPLMRAQSLMKGEIWVGTCTLSWRHHWLQEKQKFLQIVSQYLMSNLQIRWETKFSLANRLVGLPIREQLHNDTKVSFISHVSCIQNWKEGSGVIYNTSLSSVVVRSTRWPTGGLSVWQLGEKSSIVHWATFQTFGSQLLGSRGDPWLNIQHISL